MSAVYLNRDDNQAYLKLIRIPGKQERIYERMRNAGFPVSSPVGSLTAPPTDTKNIELSNAFVNAVRCETLRTQIEDCFKGITPERYTEMLDRVWPILSKRNCLCFIHESLLGCIHTPLETLERVYALLKDQPPALVESDDEKDDQPPPLVKCGYLTPEDMVVCDQIKKSCQDQDRIVAILHGISSLCKKYDPGRVSTFASGIFGATEPTRLNALTSLIVSQQVPNDKLILLESLVACNPDDARFMFLDKIDKIDIAERTIALGICDMTGSSWTPQEVSFALLTLEKSKQEILLKFLKKI